MTSRRARCVRLWVQMRRLRGGRGAGRDERGPDGGKKRAYRGMEGRNRMAMEECGFWESWAQHSRLLASNSLVFLDRRRRDEQLCRLQKPVLTALYSRRSSLPPRATLLSSPAPVFPSPPNSTIYPSSLEKRFLPESLEESSSSSTLPSSTASLTRGFDSTPAGSTLFFITSGETRAARLKRTTPGRR